MLTWRSFKRKTTDASSHPISLSHLSPLLFSIFLSSNISIRTHPPSRRRGYLQKSLVLLSRFPFVSLFKSVVRVVAEVFFDQFDHVTHPHAGSDLIEAVFLNIMKWCVDNFDFEMCYSYICCLTRMKERLFLRSIVSRSNNLFCFLNLYIHTPKFPDLSVSLSHSLSFSLSHHTPPSQAEA